MNGTNVGNLRRKDLAARYEAGVEQWVLMDVLTDIYGYKIHLTRCDNSYSINYFVPGSSDERSTAVHMEDFVRWLWRNIRMAANKGHKRVAKK